jgi:hypothetical protein
MRRPVRAAVVLGLVLMTVPALGRADEPNAAVHYRKAFELLPQLTAEDRQILDLRAAAPVDEKALDLIKRAEPALAELHRGAAVAECDWGLDFAKGFDGLADPHFRAPPLAQLACLRSLARFDKGQGADAFADLGAVITLARHLGKDGPYVSRLVQVTLEATAVDFAAVALPRQEAKTVKAVSGWLDRLPKAAPLSETVRGEKQFLLKWVRPQFENKSVDEIVESWRKIGGSDEEAEAIRKAVGKDPKGYLKLVDDHVARYEDLAKIVDLTADQYKTAVGEFEKMHPADNPVAGNLLTQAEQMRYVAAHTEVRYAMLRAAVSLILDGPEAIKASKDPFGDGPFEYQALDGGFVLKSQLHKQAKERPPVILTVGAPKKE